jgi:RNA polymerase sigma factor (sigma-70 family)
MFDLRRKLVDITQAEEDSADAVQDTYVKLAAPHRQRKFVQHPNQLAFALVTAVNLVRDVWRRRTALRMVEFKEDLHARSSDGGLHRREAELNAGELLAALDDAEATAVTLIDIEGLTVREVAQLVGSSKSAVHDRHMRALHKLKSLVTRGGWPSWGAQTA